MTPLPDNTCPTCGGSGEIVTSQHWPKAHECPTCHGTGGLTLYRHEKAPDETGDKTKAAPEGAATQVRDTTSIPPTDFQAELEQILHVTLPNDVYQYTEVPHYLAKRITALFLKAIGEDDTETRGSTQNPSNPANWTKRTTYRNELRAQLRAIVGGKE